MSLDKIKNKFFWIPTALMGFDIVLKFFHISLWLDLPASCIQDAIIWLGIIELCCLVIFLIPRTLIIGFFLLSCYWGGIIAVNLKNLSFGLFPICMLILFTIAAYWLDSSIFPKSHSNNLKQ